jgi:hypothetical protein
LCHQGISLQRQICTLLEWARNQKDYACICVAIAGTSWGAKENILESVGIHIRRLHMFRKQPGSWGHWYKPDKGPH